MVRLSVTRVLGGEEHTWSVAVDVEQLREDSDWDWSWDEMCRQLKEHVEIADSESNWNEDMPGEAWIK